MTRWTAAVAVVAVAAALLLVGNWEQTHHANAEVRGMERVLGEIGPLDGPSLSRFRYLPEFQCLLYRRNGDQLALELCADSDGRVVEAIDRRRYPPKIWSLREDEERSTVFVDRAQFDRLLVRLGLPQRYVEIAHERDEG